MMMSSPHILDPQSDTATSCNSNCINNNDKLHAGVRAACFNTGFIYSSLFTREAQKKTVAKLHDSRAVQYSNAIIMSISSVRLVL